MRRWLVAAVCTASLFTAQAQTAADVAVALIPGPYGIVLSVGRWLIKDNQQVFYIQVEGRGATPDQARANGFRLAVEQTVDNLILSETEVRGARIRRDDIITYSSGFVNKFTVLSVQHDTDYRVRMDVWVGKSQIAQRLLNQSVSGAKIDGERLATQAETIAHERTQGNRVLATVLADFPGRAFDISVGQSHVNFSDQRALSITVPVTVSWNYNYVISLWEALSAVSRPTGHSAMTVLLKPPQNLFMNWDGSLMFDDLQYMQQLVSKTVRDQQPMLQLTVFNRFGDAVSVTCQNFVFSNMDAMEHVRPDRYLMTVAGNTATIDQRYKMTMSWQVNFAQNYQAVRDLDRVQAKMLTESDCKSR
jgi:hypothetical protein